MSFVIYALHEISCNAMSFMWCFVRDISRCNIICVTLRTRYLARLFIKTSDIASNDSRKSQSVRRWVCKRWKTGLEIFRSKHHMNDIASRDVYFVQNIVRRTLCGKISRPKRIIDRHCVARYFVLQCEGVKWTLLPLEAYTAWTKNQSPRFFKHFGEKNVSNDS